MSEASTQSHSELYNKLDVSILDHLILGKVLGLVIGGGEEPRVSFTYEREESVHLIKTGEAQLIFFLNPVKPETIKAIADARDKMPRKSTYFYPKAPAGLVVNPLF